MYMKITAQLFTAIKLLLNTGATYAEVNKYYGVSAKTCQNIKAAETYDEYKSIVAAICAKQHEKRVAKKAEDKPATQPDVAPQVVEHKQTITVQATWAMMQEMQRTNELLTSISNKLAYIVEQLA